MDLFKIRSVEDCILTYEILRELPLDQCPQQRGRPYKGKKYEVLTPEQHHKLLEWCEELDPAVVFEIQQRVSYQKAHPSKRDRRKDIEIYINIDPTVLDANEAIQVCFDVFNADETEDFNKNVKILRKTSQAGFLYFEKRYKGGRVEQEGETFHGILVPTMSALFDMLFATPMSKEIDYALLKRSVEEAKVSFAREVQRPVETCRLLLVLVDLRKRLSEYRKTVSKRGCDVSKHIEDMTAFLLFESNVTVLLLAKQEELAEHVLKIARVQYDACVTDAETELALIKTKAIHAPDDMSEQEKLQYQLKHTWIQILTAIPGMSEAKAKQFVVSFPSPRALYEFLHTDPRATTEDRVNSISRLFTADRDRCERVLAASVVNSFCSVDAALPIDYTEPVAKKTKRKEVVDASQPKISAFFAAPQVTQPALTSSAVEVIEIDDD